MRADARKVLTGAIALLVLVLVLVQLLDGGGGRAARPEAQPPAAAEPELREPSTPAALAAPTERSAAIEDALEDLAQPELDQPALVGERTGTLVIRVTDLVRQEPVRDFRVRIVGIDPHGQQPGRYRHGYATTGTTTGVVEKTWRIPEQEGLAIDIALLYPRPHTDGPERPEEVAERVFLHADETLEVELGIRFGEKLRGRVVDDTLRPVADALVFFGTFDQARGDEPFDAFDPRRVRGTRTGPDGSFELFGSGPFLTAWHAEYSPTTVPRANADVVVLAPRGGIRGRAAAPPPGGELEVLLDLEHVALVGPDGAFEFPAVEAGMHAVVLPDHRMVGVRVYPELWTEIDLAASGDLVLELREHGELIEGPFQGMLIGLEHVFSVLEVSVDGGSAEYRDVIRGEYVLLSTSGHASRVTITGPVARAELGSSSLLVRGRPGRRPFLLPAGTSSNSIVLKLAARLARPIPESGELLLAPVPAGDYVLVDPAGTRMVEIAGLVELDLY